jgi:hypothetical protein
LRPELFFIGPEVIGEIAERLQHETTRPAGRDGFINNGQKGCLQRLLAFKVIVARIVIRRFLPGHDCCSLPHPVNGASALRLLAEVLAQFVLGPVQCRQA